MYYPVRVIRTDRYKLILDLAHQLPYPFASDLYASATWQATPSRRGRRVSKALYFFSVAQKRASRVTPFWMISSLVA